MRNALGRSEVEAGPGRTLGPPNACSMMTLRPLGPSVTLTAFARTSTPASSEVRPWLPKDNSCQDWRWAKDIKKVSAIAISCLDHTLGAWHGCRRDLRLLFDCEERPKVLLTLCDRRVADVCKLEASLGVRRIAAVRPIMTVARVTAAECKPSLAGRRKLEEIPLRIAALSSPLPVSIVTFTAPWQVECDAKSCA